VVVTDAVDELKEREKRVRVSGTVREEDLGKVPGVRRIIREGTGWLVYARGSREALLAALMRVPGVSGVQVLDQSLEDILISYVS